MRGNSMRTRVSETDDRRRRGWRLVLALVVAALAAAAVGCGGDDDDDDTGTEAASGETQPANILASYQESGVWAPALVARDQGYFAQEGLEPVEIEGTDGSQFVTQQVIAGNSDYGWGVADSIIIAATKQPELRAVACNTQRNIFQVLTPEDSDVQTFEDLEGKTLGFTAKGGGEEPMIQSALAEAGITDDVELLPIGDAGPQVERAL